MTGDVLDQVQQIAERQEAKPGLIFQDQYKNIIGDDIPDKSLGHDNESNYNPLAESVRD